MTHNAGLFFISLAAFSIFSARPACRNLKCPCGKTGKNFSTCITKPNLKDACNRWSGCKHCRDGLEACLTCPEGFGGQYCDQVLEIQEGDLSRQSGKTLRTRHRRYIYPEEQPDAYCDNPQSISLGRIELDPQSVPLNTSIEDQELPLGSRLLYKCNSGYSLLGAESLTCEDHGFWSEDPPICKRSSYSFHLTCSNPALISNGFNYPTFPPGSRATSGGYPTGSRLEYFCDEGYTLVGFPTMTCLRSGFWSGTKPTCDIDCGHRFRKTFDEVHDGSQRTIGDWPWVVAIKNANRIFCAGALLNPTTVLTAAQCLMGITGNLTLYFGKLHLNDTYDDEEVVIRNSSSFMVHPHFNTDFVSTNYDSDIGLIVVNQRIQFTRRIQPICLPSSDTTVDNLISSRRADVAGWTWDLQEGDLQHHLLMLANVSIRTNRECEELYSKLGGEPLKLTINQFCAGNEDGDKKWRKITGGAPMAFYNKRTERYTLEGLASFRIGTCWTKGKFVVFTNVYPFVPWIRCRMSQRRCPIV